MNLGYTSARYSLVQQTIELVYVTLVDLWTKVFGSYLPISVLGISLIFIAILILLERLTAKEEVFGSGMYGTISAREELSRRGSF